MKVIRCKAQKYGRHKKGAGCYTCGGSGIALEKFVCKCGKYGWFRPSRGITVYDGKRMYSIDGLEIIHRLNRKWTAWCWECDERGK